MTMARTIEGVCIYIHTQITLLKIKRGRKYLY